jgi:DNA-binding transcriptional LysR family regulator
MELRHLRYFVAVGEDQHYGRASRRLGVAQPALSRQIQDLEKEIGFELFDRMPRGVRLSAAGKLFLEDARRVLQELGEATARAARVARGQSGTLRIGFAENVSWHGVAPDSFRRFREQNPDVDLQLQPAASLEQLDAIRSGHLDAGFINFMPKADADLDQLAVGRQPIELAVPKTSSHTT